VPQKHQEVIHNRIINELTESVPHQPGGVSPVRVPKKDKILEWTLYGIYEQLQGINIGINTLITELRMRPK